MATYESNDVFCLQWAIVSSFERRGTSLDFSSVFFEKAKATAAAVTSEALANKYAVLFEDSSVTVTSFVARLTVAAASALNYFITSS